MQSKRKFYRTVLQLEILSEEPYEGSSLEGINYDITDGGCSGSVVDVVRNEVLTAKRAAMLARSHGTEPEFFMLNEKGEDDER